MGTIVEKSEYLTETKDKIKESINNLGGDITSETTFREYAEELDNIYDNLPKTTGEDTNLSLTTLKGRMNIIPKGNIEQETTTGYNLLPTLDTQTIDNVTLTKNNDGTFNIVGNTGTNAIAFSLYIDDISLYDFSQNYYTMVTNKTGLRVDMALYNNDTWVATPLIRTSADTVLYKTSSTYITSTYNRVRYVITLAANTNYNLTNIYVMLYKGNYDSSKGYEKYTDGIASPNPSFPSDIEVVTGTQEVRTINKNWLGSETQNNWGVASIEAQTPGQILEVSGRYAKYGKIVGGQTYTISRKSVGGSTYFYCGFYANEPQIGSTAISVYDMGASVLTSTKTAPSNANYIVVFCGAKLSEELQVEVGNSKTDYVSHQEQTQIVELSSKNLFGDTLRQGVTIYATGTYDQDSIIRITTTNWITLPKGTYTMSAKTNQNTTLAISNITFDTNDNYYEVTNVTGQWKTLPFTITLPQDTKWKCNLSYTNGQEIYPSEISEMQIEVGSQKTTYEQYYNYELCKIGNYQDYFYKTSGKNLAKEVKIVEGTTAYNGVLYLDIENDLQPNTTYTLSFIGKNGYKVYLNENITTAQWVTCNGSKQSLTFTTSGNIDKTNSGQYSTSVGGWVIFKNQSENTETPTFTQVQLELGTATTYEPYGSDKWYKKEQIGKARLTGTAQTWEATSTNTSEKKRYRTMDFASVIVAPSQNNEIGKILSNYYTPQVVATAGSYGGHQGISIDTSGYVFINDDNYLNNLNGWKTWLDSVECNIYCVLQTANDIEITNETLIQQLDNLEKLMSYNGTTNISSSGNLPMVLSVSALKGE